MAGTVTGEATTTTSSSSSSSSSKPMEQTPGKNSNNNNSHSHSNSSIELGYHSHRQGLRHTRSGKQKEWQNRPKGNGPDSVSVALLFFFRCCLLCVQ